MKKRNFRPTTLLAIGAVALIAIGGIGTTRALPTITGQNHVVEAGTQKIKVQIIENDQVVASSDKNETGSLLTNMLGEDEKLLLNKTYTENIDVKNTDDSIDAYVRVIVRKYWTDANGEKNTAIDPDTIQLDFADGWSQVDVSAEETILYYPTIVTKGQSLDLADGLTIDGKIATKVSYETNGNTRKTVYAYDGYDFNIDVTVNSIQTHSASAAILSQWGVDAASVGINVIPDEELEVNAE